MIAIKRTCLCVCVWVKTEHVCGRGPFLCDCGELPVNVCVYVRIRVRLCVCVCYMTTGLYSSIPLWVAQAQL